METENRDFYLQNFTSANKRYHDNHQLIYVYVAKARMCSLEILRYVWIVAARSCLA